VATSVAILHLDVLLDVVQRLTLVALAFDPNLRNTTIQLLIWAILTQHFMYATRPTFSCYLLPGSKRARHNASHLFTQVKQGGHCADQIVIFFELDHHLLLRQELRRSHQIPQAELPADVAGDKS